METIAQIGQGLLYGAVYLLIWLNGPAQQHRRLLHWERERPGRIQRKVQPVSWAFCITGAYLITAVISMNMRVIFHW